MTPSEFVQSMIDGFFSAIEPVKNVYQSDSFSYFSLKSVDGFVLVRGTIWLNVTPPSIPLARFQSESVRAGHFFIRDMGVTREQLVAQLQRGAVHTPHGELIFPPNSNNREYNANFLPFHEIGLSTRRRVPMLSLFGNENRDLLRQQLHYDWELRAAATPFDGTEDLLNTFQPGALAHVNTVDLVAFEVLAVDAASVVDGERALITVRAASHVETDRVSVGYRVLAQGRVCRRAQLSGDAFTWRLGDNCLIGTAELCVSRAAVVHAFAIYNGVTQHHQYFSDPKSSQNPRRAAYEAFDPQFRNLTDIMLKAQGLRPDSREFEAAMPWLFWMLGFSPAYIGGPPRMRDAADFVMSSPSGHVAVVECTVGLLKDDGKLPKLHDRTQAVRRELNNSGAQHLHVLPIIITCKTRQAVRPDLEQAEKLGIYVITKERLDELLLITLSPPNADKLYDEAEKATMAAQEMYQKYGSAEALSNLIGR